MNNVLNYIINMQNGSFGAGVNQAQSQVAKLDGMVNRLGATMAAALTVNKLLDIADETTKVASKFERMNNKLEFASGAKAGENMQFLKTTIDALALPLETATEGYSNYLGVIKGTNLEGERGNKIFGDIAIGFKGARLDTDQQTRAMGALYKMISTGNVQADEFKQQFAEAIPGAMAMAEKATGLTMEQFTKEMEKGNINSIKFVEDFSKVMRSEYQENLPAALRSFESQMNLVENSIIEQKMALGNELMPVQMMWMQMQLTGYKILTELVKIYKDNKDIIDTLAVALIGGATAYYALLIASRAYAIGQAIAATATALYTAYTVAASYGTTGFAGAMWALNVAMTANPIGIIIVAIAALVGILYYAWNHSEKFRVIMKGVWEVLKSVAEIIGRIIMLPFQIFLDPKGAIESIKKIKDLTMGLGDDFDAGIKKGFADEKTREQEKAAGTNTGLPPEFQKKLDEYKAGLGTSGGAGTKPINVLTDGKGGKGTKDKNKTEGTSGSKQVRNITLNFKSAIGEVKINSTNIQSLSQTQLKQILTDLIVGAAHDAEVMIANN